MSKGREAGWGIAWTTDFVTVHFFSDGRSLCGRAQGAPGVPRDLRELQAGLTCRRCETLYRKRVNGGKSE